MPEIIWKQGAENDLLQIFAELEEHTTAADVRFTSRLDFTLGHLQAHPEMAPIFEEPVRRLVIGSTGYGLFYTAEQVEAGNLAESACARVPSESARSENHRTGGR